MSWSPSRWTCWVSANEITINKDETHIGGRAMRESRVQASCGPESVARFEETTSDYDREKLQNALPNWQAVLPCSALAA